MWWTEQVLPRLVERALGGETAAADRRQVCSAAAGHVLEIGFGSGLNLPYYPSGVQRVSAVEPADLAWRRAQARIAGFGRPVVRVGRDASCIDLPDRSVDCAVSTWTMCTVPRLPEALAELRRLLRPGGVLLFVEHGRAPDHPVARAQDLVQPAWGRVAGGCHVTRDIPGALQEAGMTVDVVASHYRSRLLPGKVFTWFSVGAASVSR